MRIAPAMRVLAMRMTAAAEATASSPSLSPSSRRKIASTVSIAVSVMGEV